MNQGLETQGVGPAMDWMDMTRPLPLAWREVPLNRLRIERPNVTASEAENEGKRQLFSSTNV
jgi:hypothetical protein